MDLELNGKRALMTGGAAAELARPLRAFWRWKARTSRCWPDAPMHLRRRRQNSPRKPDAKWYGAADTTQDEQDSELIGPLPQIAPKIVVGPGSPSLLSNVIVSTEEQIDWLATLIKMMDAGQHGAFEATREAEQAWVAHVHERAAQTLYLSTPSYYNGAEVAGKPRVFMPYSGGVRGYRRILQRCAAEGYSGFELRPAAPSAMSASRTEQV